MQFDKGTVDLLGAYNAISGMPQCAAKQTGAVRRVATSHKPAEQRLASLERNFEVRFAHCVDRSIYMRSLNEGIDDCTRSDHVWRPSFHGEKANHAGRNSSHLTRRRLHA